MVMSFDGGSRRLRVGDEYTVYPAGTLPKPSLSPAGREALDYLCSTALLDICSRAEAIRAELASEPSRVVPEGALMWARRVKDKLLEHHCIYGWESAADFILSLAEGRKPTLPKDVAEAVRAAIKDPQFYGENSLDMARFLAENYEGGESE